MDQLSLETILKEFSVEDEVSLLKKRTTEKQVKPSEIVEAPRLVPMTPDQCKRLCEKAKMQYHPGYDGRVIERVTTTELPDRYGDIVRYKGADIADYKKNAVVLHAHEHGNPPVGKSLKLWSDPAIKGWRSWDLHFGNEIDPTGYYEYIFRLVASGAMPGGSIGFLPTGDGVKADHTPEERESMGLGKYGVEYLAWKYLEHSVCSVPANPEALANNLKMIGVPRLVKFFSQGDLDGMERLKILDGNMLDVFAVTLGIKGSGHHGHEGVPGQVGGSSHGEKADGGKETKSALKASLEAHKSSTAAADDPTKENVDKAMVDHTAAKKLHEEASARHQELADKALADEDHEKHTAHSEVKMHHDHAVIGHYHAVDYHGKEDGHKAAKVHSKYAMDHAKAAYSGLTDTTKDIEIDIFNIFVDLLKDTGVDLKDTEEYEMRPYPNEHACRLVDPDKFDKMRRGKRKHEGKEYSVIFGHYKDKDSWGEQAYRYPKGTWTSAEAKSHCKSHDGISFEPASDGKSIEDECTTCGTQKPVVVNVTVTGLEKLLDEIESLKKQVAELSYREATPSADQRRAGGKKLHEMIFDINQKP